MAAAEAGGVDIIGIIENVSNIIWAGTWGDATIIPVPPMVVILLGAGLYIMFGLRFYPIRKLGSAFAGLFKGRKGEGDGEISPSRRFQLRSPVRSVRVTSPGSRLRSLLADRARSSGCGSQR